MAEVRQNWQLWHAHIDVDKIPELEEELNPQAAATFGGDTSNKRRSKVAWVYNSLVEDLLYAYVLQAASVIGVDVVKQSEIQYTIYEGSAHGHYDWHHDVDWNNNDGRDRKLSITVQLSDPGDYEGGDFEFSEVPALPENYKDKGSVLVFPSFLMHRVLPVTAGIRKSLVAWFWGPQWR